MAVVVQWRIAIFCEDFECLSSTGSGSGPRAAPAAVLGVLATWQRLAQFRVRSVHCKRFAFVDAVFWQR